MNKFWNARHAADRIADTVIRVEDKPAYIHRVSEEKVVKFSFLTKMDSFHKIHAESDAVNICPMSVGNMNTQFGLVRLERQPARRYKQGIALHSLMIEGPYLPSGLLGFPYDLNNMFLNIYPDVEECIAKSKTLEWGCAFSKDFAIFRGKELWYKRIHIGTYTGGNVTLKDEYFFMKEFVGSVM